MAHAIEAPASTTAEGPTSHTQNQGAALLNGLDPDQIVMLREELEPWRIGDDGKGHSAIEHWDVRRTLIRVFGVGGFDIVQVVPPECIAVLEIKPDSGNGPSKYTVVYKALSRLVIRNRRGVQLAVFEDGAIDEGLKQPSLSQAHDQGYKGAMSGALKRCAMNLGDPFGLSLYNKGSEVPVVYTPADRYRDQAVAAWDDFAVIGQTHAAAKQDKVLEHKVWNFDGSARVHLWRLLQDRGTELRAKDPKAGAEQGGGQAPSGADEAGSTSSGMVVIDPEVFRPHPDGQDFANQAALATTREAVENVRSMAAGQQLGNAGVLAPDSGQPDVLAAYLDRRVAEMQPAPSGPSKHLAKLLRQTTDCWKAGNVLVFEQIKADAEKHGVVDEEFTAKDGTRTTLRKVLDGRIAELKAAQGGARSAA